MKKYLLLLVVFIIIPVSSFCETDYDNLERSFENLLEYVKNLLSNDRNYQYSNPPGGHPLYGGKVSASKNIQIPLVLNSRTDYYFFAGTNRTSVPFKIYRGSGTNGALIGEGMTPVEKANIIKHRIDIHGVYTIVLENPSRESAFLTLLVLEAKNNRNLDLQGLVTPMNKLKEAFRDRGRGNSSLNVISDVISFFGNLVNRRSYIRHEAQLPANHYEFLVSGITDIKVFVNDTGTSNFRNKDQDQPSIRSKGFSYGYFSLNTSRNYYFYIDNENNYEAFAVGLLVLKPRN